MKISLIGNKSINTVNLPKEVSGEFWISTKTNENEENKVKICVENKKWVVKTTENVKIINPQNIVSNNNELKVTQSPNMIIEKAILNEYTVHYLYIGDYRKIYILYAYPKNEGNFVCLDVSKASYITIGNSPDSKINYNNNMIKDIHAQINYIGNQMVIQDFGSQFCTFVNGEPLSNDIRNLNNGDVIFILGLVIVIMNKEIFINNPLNRVKYNKEEFKLIQRKQIINDKNNKYEEPEVEIYAEKDYFFRAPKITPLIEKEIMTIDPPPTKKEPSEKSFLLVLGSSLAMSVTMLAMLINTMYKISTDGVSLNSVTRIITSIAMMFGVLAMPMITRKVQKKQMIRVEKQRQEKYIKYLKSKQNKILNIINKQRDILNYRYQTTEECVKIILEKTARLWERKITDKDFLVVRLGEADVESELEVEYPREKFKLEEDELEEKANEVVENSKYIKNAPMTFSLMDKNISAIVSNNDVENYVQNIILQLIALHSYKELKLVFLVKDSKYDWEYVKKMPHIWDDEKKIRFFANNYIDMQEISIYLNDKFMKRMEKSEEKNKDKYQIISPYYLIITDDYKNIENLNIIFNILKCEYNMGFSILCISNQFLHLPDECKDYIYLNESESIVYHIQEEGEDNKIFSYETSQMFYVDRIVKSIANIPIKATVSKETTVNKSFSFLEMFNVGRIEHLNILDRWNNNDPTKTLKAQIGLDSLGMPIYLDVHEKFHGPHGLIAGSTGSGKSEFIITYILSLAINYKPEEVAFVLVDYKGGGLAGAFKKGDIELPHLIGTITNIDTHNLQRALLSIKSELTRRQKIFNDTRELIDEGTIDIYKYQRLYRQGVIKKPVPHLLIICDEFAELKQQQAEFMDELMSVSRIGRSLGVHLILATQKPAGIVNDQIRSNSKFGICLKVQDKSDSLDVVKKPDAAYLKNPGQFYFNVGNEEYFVSGQSAWSGAAYIPTDDVRKKVDTSINFISNIGTVIADVDNQVQKKVENQGEQLTSIVKYLDALSKKENFKKENLWLPSMEEVIYTKDLKEKYKNKKEKEYINPVIGEYDNPQKQSQGLIHLDMTKGGNAIIFGNAESGKETLLTTLAYELISSYTSEEVWMYILDFGTEVLKIFNGAPHVGDVAVSEENEKVTRFFEMILQEMKNRKEILSEYNGDYNLYLKSGNKMPMIIIIINNYEMFLENKGNSYEEQLLLLTREGIKFRINFVVTLSSTNSMRYRLSQNFKQKIVLQMNKETDYTAILDRMGKLTIPKIFGRGLVSLDNKNVYEIQIAKIAPAEEWDAKIREAIDKAKKENTMLPKRIPVLPKVLTFDMVQPYLDNLSNVPIGMNKNNLSIFTYDFINNFITVFVSKNIMDVANYASKLAKLISNLKNVNIKILDFEKSIDSDLETTDSIEGILNDAQNMKETDVHTLYIISGISKLSELMKNQGNNLKQILINLQAGKKFSVIILDNALKLKAVAFEDWYKYFTIGDPGIWVGKGVVEQYSINFDLDRRVLMQNLGSTFGYITNKSKANIIKLLEVYEEGEEDNE